MVSPQAMLVAVVAGLAIWGGTAVAHGVKKIAQKSSHAVVHVVTLGKK